MTDRAGTASREVPDSSAKRIPVTAVCGSPARSAVVAAAERLGADTTPPRAAVGRVAETDRDGRRARHDDEREQTETEHGPVEGDPGVGIERPHGTERRQWRQHRGDHDREQRPDTGGRDRAGHAVEDGHRRARTDRTEHVEIVGAGAQLPPDRLARDHERGQRDDRAEDAEGDRVGLDRPFGLRDDRRGDGEGRDLARRREMVDLLLDGRDVARAMIELQADARHGDAAREQGFRQRGGELHCDGACRVDVVPDDVTVEDHDADERRINGPVRLHARGAEPGARGLRVGEDPEARPIADAQPEKARAGRTRDEFIGARGIRHPAFDGAGAVLVEVEPVDAARTGAAAAGARDRGRAVGAQRQEVEPDPALDVANVGEPRDLRDDLRVVAG